MKYLLIGNKGQLGKEFEKYFNENKINYLGIDKFEVDIVDFTQVNTIFKNFIPNIVINCAAYNLVDQAEKDTKTAYGVNEKGTVNIATACKKYNSFLVHYSTNYVFDGNDPPYNEDYATNPISEYGKSKLAGEKAIQDELNENNYLIFRLSWLYGVGKQNFVHKFMEQVNNSGILMGTIDEKATPTSTRLVVNVTINSLQNGLTGLYHLANSGTASRWDWANEILKILDIDKKIEMVKIEKFNLPAKRPKDATLNNRKIQKDLGIKIPHWKEELKIFLEKAYEK